MLVIVTLSLGANSSVSFLNQVMLIGSGFESNLQLNSASCPSLILMFSTLPIIIGDATVILIFVINLGYNQKKIKNI